MAEWGRVKSVFEEIVDLPSDRQESMLVRLCDGDATLRSDVEALLTAHVQAGSFLETPKLSVDQLPSTDVSLIGPRLGSKIGPYALVEVIGEGGFGTVYRAEQESPVRRTVALKLLKPGMDSREVVRRFEAERQALALMDHPHIAKALDAGATATGQPYFVMELVQGAPITEFCDQQRLGLSDRLKLMVDVCNAVQHAHQKGIIHRDLKPTNVLVTLSDARPVAKIIDFGVAKAIDRRLWNQTLMTEVQQLVGTPAYMSPEQARLTGGDVDTRTDIYALGVLLYELMTGVLPFGSETLREATLNEFQRIVREIDPPTPSTRISRLSRESGATKQADEAKRNVDEIAAQRGVSPRVLRVRLRGDLDWIVMKCLEKDRERRYAAAGDLASDLERHLRDEPVLAGPPSPKYRLQKFVRRHRAAVLASSAVVVALLGGLGLAISGFVSARSARDVAEQQRTLAVEHAKRAEIEAEKAKAVNEFLQQTLASANPRERPLGQDVTVRQVLNEAVARLRDGSLTHQPEIEGAVRMTIGAALRELALYEEAAAQFAGAIEIRAKLQGDRSVEYADALCGLAAVEELSDRHVEAEKLFRQALEINRAQRKPTDREYIVNLTDLATTLNSQARYDESEAISREAIDLARRAGGERNPDLADPLNNLGLTLSALSRDAEAEVVIRQALEINRAQSGRQAPAIATNLDNLATALAKQGKKTEAEAAYREALRLREGLFGDNHPDVAYTLHNLAALSFTIDRDRPEIEAMLRRAFDILKRIDGLANLDTLTVLDSLVSVIGGQGKLDEAEKLLLEAYDVVGAADNLPEWRRQAIAERLSQLYQARQQTDKAAEWAARSKAAASTTAPTSP